MEQRIAPATFLVTTAADSGPNSLRQAILDANSGAFPGLDTINFNIPGAAAGLRTIALLSALPAITDPLVIDGYTQPGSSVNTLGAGAGTNAVPLIELNGASATAANGLVINASNSKITGLVINRFANDGIVIAFGSGTTIEGNFIGTNATGSTALGNGSDGIFISQSANNTIGGTSPAARNLIAGNVFASVRIEGQTAFSNIVAGNLIGTNAAGAAILGTGRGSVTLENLASGNVIGGTSAAARNVISGSTGEEVMLTGGASGNLIQGNYIGTDVTGTLDLGNGTGVFLGDAGSNTIGGTTPGAGNLISGNRIGILIQGTTTNVMVQGNLIGTDAAGTGALGNSVVAISIQGASNHVIGGIGINEPNTIAFNDRGIVVTGAANGVSIRGNSIHSNTGLGIDLQTDGVTLNDSLDADSGPNGFQNFPDITSAGATSVSGNFNGAPSTTLTLDFYSSPAPDATGFGEGRVYLGAQTITTNAAGFASFNFTPGTPIAGGSFVTATATNSTAGTSEFSQAVVVLNNVFTWDGSTSSDWFTASNWTPDGVPGAGDTARLNINSTINLPSSTSVGIFQQSTGTFTSPTGVTFTVLNSFDWSGGTQSGTGTTTLASGGTGSLSGTVALNGRTLDNAGVIVESGRVDFSGTGRLNNLAGGAFDFARPGGGSVLSGAASAPGFFNAGTVRHPLAVTSSVNGPFTNLAGGIIDVTQGTLNFQADGSWQGADFRIATGSTVNFRNATSLTLSGNYTGSGGGRLEFSGGTQGASAGLGVSGSFTVNFPDGFFRFGDNATFGSGTIVNNGFMSIEGRPNVGGTVDNAGTIKHSANIDFFGGGQINNLATGVYEVQSGSSGSIFNGAATGFFNAGTFRYNGAGDGVGVPFHGLAGGSIEATSGIVSFNRDGAWGNTSFLIAAGAEVNLNAGTKTWSGTFTGSGGGILRLGGGTQGASAGGFLTPGAGGATLNFPSGFFHFSGNATINSGGVLTNLGEITTADFPNLNGMIDNAGVVRNLGQLEFGAGARFDNRPGGTFEQARVGGGTVASGVGEFFNAGTIRLTEAGTHTIAVPWNNLAGTSIDVTAGTLAFHSAGNWEGATIQIATGSEVTLNSGDKVWTGTFAGTGGGVLRLGGGTQGASAGGRITVGTGGATINFPNGGFEFSGNASLDGELLTNAGKLTFADRPNLGLTLNNTGTMINQGQIDFSPTGRINNEVGGVFEIAKVAGGGFTTGGSSVPGIFNAGTLLLAIDTDVDSGVPFSNSGLVNVTAGTLRFPGAVFTQTAGSTSLAGGDLGGGTLNFAGGELTGVGSIFGNVSNTGATVRPGGTGAAGTLTTSGNYTQGAGGTLEIEIGGEGAGEFDAFGSGGNAILGGTLNATLINGFTPDSGAFFTVLTANQRSGTFATVTGPLTAQYNPTNVTLVAPVAQPFIWDAGGGADTSWFNPLNWDRDSGFPGATDTAILQINATTTLPSSTSVGTLIHNIGPAVGDTSIFTIPAGSTLTVLNNFTWTGGTENGAGTLTVAAGATFTYPNGSPTFLTQRTLNLLGTSTFSNTTLETMTLANGATINNSGVLEIRNGLSLTGVGTFNNLVNGTVKGTTSNTFLVTGNNLAFNNAGIVSAQAGTLGFNGGYVQTAGTSEMFGGILNIAGFMQLQGGVLQGTGAYVGSINNTGGILRPGGAGATGTLSTNGGYIQTAGGTLEVEISGTGAGQFDVFAPGGVANLLGGGTLAAPLLGGFTPAAGDQFPVLTASTVVGTFSTTPGGFTTQYNPQNVTLIASVGPNPLVVNTAVDVVNANDAFTSLREAIIFANSNPGLDTIGFNIPGAGVQQIVVTSALPVITEAVVIDGYTQPGASANTLTLGDDAALRIQLDGAGAGAGVNGLHISAGGSTVRGLSIGGFNGVGVLLTGGGGNQITGNFIGLAPDGSTLTPNVTGIRLEGSSDNTIGGNASALRNVISGNSAPGGILQEGAGVLVQGGGTANNTIENNYIGLGADGSSARPNSKSGVAIYNGGNGANFVRANVISGNLGHGVDIAFSSHGNTVESNLLGFGADGVTARGNAGGGVLINFSSNNNLVGGTTATLGNRIGYNATGVAISIGTSNNMVFANIISNSGNDGIAINSFNNIIGSPTLPNVILGNTRHGIMLTGATGNLVQGNFIGVTPSTFPGGSAAVPNGGAGIALVNGASGNDIGGTSVGNIIAGNTGDGVLIDHADDNVIRGNRIGQTGLNSGFFPNGGAGVHIIDGADNRIGGPALSELNIISHNTGAGILVEGSGAIVTARGNILEGNGGLGIDLAAPGDPANGVTPNDAGDSDSGPNTLLNFPTVNTVTRTVVGDSYNYVASGTYSGASNTTVTIDLYANDVADASGFGEGQFLITSFTVTTDGTGQAAFSQTFSSAFTSVLGTPLGAFITGTATLGDGTAGPTSEFSQAIEATAAGLTARISNTAVVEGQRNTNLAVFTVRLSEPATEPVGIHYTTRDLIRHDAAIAGEDYDFQEGDITFGIGERTKEIMVVVRGDRTPETREWFGLTLSNASGAGLENNEAVGAILDDDHHLLFAGQGVGSQVEIRNATTGNLVRRFFAFSPEFKGGVRVASGDVNGDGFNDVIVGAGNGGGARVRVFDGHDVDGGRPVKLYDFQAFGSGYRGGVYVAAGDVNGDGHADIIVAPSAGSSAEVRIFDGENGTALTSFFAFGRGAGGVRVATGDVNGDGFADIIAGTGKGSSVRVFDGQDPSVMLDSFRAFPRVYDRGISVAGGDVNGDGRDDVIVGAAKLSKLVRIFLSGEEGRAAEFAAYDGPRHGVQVGAVDINSDGIADIITSQGRGGDSKVRIYKGNSVLNDAPKAPIKFNAFGPNYSGGVFVG